MHLLEECPSGHEGMVTLQVRHRNLHEPLIAGCPRRSNLIEVQVARIEARQPAQEVGHAIEGGSVSDIDQPRTGDRFFHEGGPPERARHAWKVIHQMQDRLSR
ncbi:MAG: hypothetical protein QOI59_6378 [Gammaproteobacteria bacterium]|nr:hypothetical protein [Gammaproteobacteria bacterium]